MICVGSKLFAVIIGWISLLITSSPMIYTRTLHYLFDSPNCFRTAVVACMDARLHPEKALGLSIGDSHMIRNVRFSVNAALYSYLIR